MVLLHVLHALAPEQRWRLVVAHFNHRLRGRTSDTDERFVAAAAARLGLEFVCGRAAAEQGRGAKGKSTEMLAREWRHEFLARAAVEHRCPVMALAHHADDQVELFFLRLLRGAGGRGLAGMRWRSPAPSHPGVELVRPLLGVRKADLEAFAGAAGIAFRRDASNDSRAIPRNRIRHELLPLLARDYSPAVAETVLRAMDILGGEHELIERLAARWIASSRRGRFERLSVAVQRQCLQQQLLGLGIVPEFEWVEALRLQPGRAITCRDSRRVWRDADGWLRRSERPVAAAFNPESVRLKLAGRHGETEFGSLRIAWRLASPGSVLPLGQSVAGRECFDAASGPLRPAIRLRHWRAGDRFQPIGMTRPVKVQDLFTNLKVPAARRRELVLAETLAGEIFWVEGLRLAERFKVTPATKQVLEWRWQRGDGAPASGPA